jgi:hypothetical protein
MPRIDIHTHFQCLDFVKHLLGRSAFPRSVLDGGTYAVDCAAGFRVPALPKIIDMDAKLRDLEAMDIAEVIVDPLRTPEFISVYWRWTGNISSLCFASTPYGVCIVARCVFSARASRARELKPDFSPRRRRPIHT